MKTRPMLFNGPMVRALLDGSKTQTRRVCKKQPYPNGYHWDGNDFLCHNDYLPPSAMLMDAGGKELYTTSNMEGWESECPYGQPSDQIYVKETWSHDAPDLEACRVAHEDAMGGGTYGPYYHATETAPETLEWKPSIHMPRWASRITLEIVSVRVERLNDISEEDARAEGITDGGCINCGEPEPCKCSWPMPDARESFIRLWESINGPNSWFANPWCWVITFKRVLT